MKSPTKYENLNIRRIIGQFDDAEVEQKPKYSLEELVRKDRKMTQFDDMKPKSCQDHDLSDSTEEHQPGPFLLHEYPDTDPEDGDYEFKEISREPTLEYDQDGIYDVTDEIEEDEDISNEIKIKEEPREEEEQVKESPEIEVHGEGLLNYVQQQHLKPSVHIKREFDSEVKIPHLAQEQESVNHDYQEMDQKATEEEGEVTREFFKCTLQIDTVTGYLGVGLFALLIILRFLWMWKQNEEVSFLRSEVKELTGLVKNLELKFSKLDVTASSINIPINFNTP